MWQKKKICSLADYNFLSALAPYVTLGKSPPLSGPWLDSKMGADSCFQ